MRPLLIVWPYWPLFWAVCIWAFLPEARIIWKARKAAAHADSPDAGSVRLIVLGGGIGAVIAVSLAWVPALRVPTALAPAVFLLGVATMVAGASSAATAGGSWAPPSRATYGPTPIKPS